MYVHEADDGDDDNGRRLKLFNLTKFFVLFFIYFFISLVYSAVFRGGGRIFVSFGKL